MQEIRTEHLTVGYDKTPLIGDVNLSVRPGEILTLIGPNGSGKSTILKTITKQLKKLDGTVFLGEASMDELKDSQISRRLSMVMTERLRTELMSGREVVASGRYPYTGRFGILSKEDWAKVDEAIALVHAGEVQDQDFMKISDGQRQRLMLARAICQDTKILILDEPTSYLDMGFKMDILTNIRMLARDKKMAVIMSLHELDLAQKVSDTIACVRGDRIDCVGTPEEIFAGNYVQELYGVADQSFDPVTGQIFLCTGYEKAVVSRDFSAENCSGKNFGCGKKNPDPVSPQFFVIRVVKIAGRERIVVVIAAPDRTRIIRAVCGKPDITVVRSRTGLAGDRHLAEADIGGCSAGFYNIHHRLCQQESGAVL